MGLFDRFKGRKKEEPEAAVPAADLPKFQIMFRIPAYFKMEEGEYHVIVDGGEEVSKPLKTVKMELTEGKHSLRVFSAPETLDDVTLDFEIHHDKIISISVNAKTRKFKIFDEETHEVLNQ